MTSGDLRRVYGHTPWVQSTRPAARARRRPFFFPLARREAFVTSRRTGRRRRTLAVFRGDGTRDLKDGRPTETAVGETAAMTERRRRAGRDRHEPRQRAESPRGLIVPGGSRRKFSTRGRRDSYTTNGIKRVHINVHRTRRRHDSCFRARAYTYDVLINSLRTCSKIDCQPSRFPSQKFPSPRAYYCDG